MYFLKELNFTQLDPYVEFYTFTLFGFDDGCTDKTRDGRTPLDGDAEYTFVRKINFNRY